MEKKIDILERSYLDEEFDELTKKYPIVDGQPIDSNIIRFLSQLQSYYSKDTIKSMNHASTSFNRYRRIIRYEVTTILKETFRELKIIHAKSCELSEKIYSDDIEKYNSQEEQSNIPNEFLTGITLWNIHNGIIKLFSECVVLAEYGFSDAANTRWRTMFEYFVVQSALFKADSFEVTKRYHDHDIVGHYKAAAEIFRINNHKVDDYDELEEEYQQITGKYDKEFTYQFGWYSIIDKEAIKSFPAFIKSVKVETLGGYVKEANIAVHSYHYNLVKASNFNMTELIDSFETTLQNMAITLINSTLSLLNYYSKNIKKTLATSILMNSFLLHIERVAKCYFDERKRINPSKPSYDEIKKSRHVDEESAKK